ncbi:cell division protein DivIVA, partial [Bifidobacteriaceae bacterium NR015]
VDAALSRLERAVVDKCTEQELAQCGRVAWKARVEALYRKLLQHAQRDYRDRFDRGSSRHPSYARKQVDIMVDQALDKIALMLGHELEWETDKETLQDIDSAYVSNVIFTQKNGKHGYDERQVDYYLNACVRLLSSLESFERVEQYVDADNSSSSYSRAESESYSAPASIPPSVPPSVIPVTKAEEPAESSESTESYNHYEEPVPSFAPSIKPASDFSAASESAASSASAAASSASSIFKPVEDAAEDEDTADRLPKIAPRSIPSVPNHDKQSIFAPVDYANQDSNDSFEALNKSERAIFTPHAAASKPSNVLDDADSNDELLQSATVMRNSSEASVLPPSFTPAARNRNNSPAPMPAPAPAPAPSESIPSFAPQDSAQHSSQHSSLNIPELHVSNLQPSKPLSLDIPDLSFPIIGHIDESTNFGSSSQDDDDSENNDRN